MWCLILFLYFLILITTGECRRGGGEIPRYRTAYACEGNELHISCEDGRQIQLVRANYGRFSISICNEHGNLDWSVDCTSSQSFEVIQQSCGMKTNCSLQASTTVFGDPCPGTLKYLEAHYKCVPESSAPTPVTTTPSTTSTITSSSTTSRPPIIIPVTRYPRPPLPSSTENGNGTSTTSASSAPASSSSSPPPERSSSTPDVPPTTLALETTQEGIHSYKAVAPEQEDISAILGLTSTVSSTTTELLYIPTEEPRYCPPITTKSLHWNWTLQGKEAVQKCPGGALGRARWRCDSRSARWTPDSPDLSDCTSLWVDNIKYRIARGDSVVNLAVELSTITRTKPLYGGDILQTTEILHRLISKMADRVQDIAEEKQRQRLLQELTEFVLEVGSNLLEDFQRPSWQDLPPSQQRRAASGLMQSLERSGWLLAESHLKQYTLKGSQNNILLSVKVMESSENGNLLVPMETDRTWWRTDDCLVLPSRDLLPTSKQGITRVVFAAYDHMGELLGAQVRNLDSIEGSSNVTRMVNSRIIATSSVGHPFASMEIPVTITMQHIQVDNVTNPLCAFWDFKMRAWSPEGCWVTSTNITHTTCQCDHLATVVLLMEVTATEATPHQEINLRVIVYVGCAVSTICFLVTLLVLQFVRCLRNDRTAIHKHLCLCLLLSEVTVAGGLDQTALFRACCIVAGILHYLLLAAFAWAFLDSFQLYVMLVEIFDSEKWRLRWYCSVAYGVPLLVVGISALIDPESYGTEQYCWLRVDNYYIFSFGGPAIACAMAALLFLSMTFWRSCCHRSGYNESKNKDHTKLTSVGDEDALSQVKQRITVWTGEATLVLILLCSTWGFFILYLHEESAVTAYTFTSLNTLLSLMVFGFYSIRAGMVNKSYSDCSPSDGVCGCLRKSHSGQRRRNLYAPADVVSDPRNSIPHQNWNSSSNSSAMPDRQSQLPSTPLEPEEHPLQYLLQIAGPANRPTAPPSGNFDLALSESSRSRRRRRKEEEEEEEEEEREEKHQWPHQRTLCWKAENSPTVKEPLYECVDKLDSRREWGQGVSPQGNRRLSSSGYVNDRNLLSSLAAVLTGSPRTRHILRDSYLRPQVAYSGIHSPTDSDRSSSSLMEGHESVTPPSSPAPEVTDSQCLQSLPNLKFADGGSLSASLTY